MEKPPSIAEALALGREQIEPMEARILLRYVLDCTPATLVAWPERLLSWGQWTRYADLVERRHAGEPVAYLLGMREFYGRPFKVGPAVLIPRPETELLVELALARFGDRPGVKVLDLGTGSGALAITLALELPAPEVMAVDASLDALDIAAANAAALGAEVSFVESDWFNGLSGGEFDLIVSNPPYIAEADPHLAQGDLRFEPRQALAAGADGLDDLRRIIIGAPDFLAPQGWLMLEHGYDQAAAVRELMVLAGYAEVASWQDLAGIERATVGRLA
ncbi:MAG: peptide chain release factor N(5)-glutamine methyltransferase [Zoogloea sp.]|nr:peptide chain release factor N(5)-glutamine methyltransferase [Zoogloea sp.]